MIIELLVDLYQSIMATFFLIKCLKVKKKLKPPVVWCIGIVCTFLYLVVQNYIKLFEGNGIVVYLLISLPFSIICLEGSMLKKIIYNIILVIVLIFSAIIAGSSVAFLFQTNYIQMIYNGGMVRYLAVVINQIILFVCMFAIIRLVNNFKEMHDYAYAVLSSLIPIISIFLCGLILKIDNGSKNSGIYTIVVIVGIVTINIINFMLLAKEQKRYQQQLQEKIRLTSLEYQKADIEEIKRVHHDNERARHEFNRIINMIEELLVHEEVIKAEEYIAGLVKNDILQDEEIFYTSNIIINHLLNRKKCLCQQSNISFQCLIEGELMGIDDLDFHILLENLLDNAIEAAEQSKDRFVSLAMHSDESCLGIEISNSTQDDVVRKNPVFRTTKSDKLHHGYGLDNIRSIVDKYQGKIVCTQEDISIVTFKIVLIKM